MIVLISIVAVVVIATMYERDEQPITMREVIDQLFQRPNND